MVNLQYCVRDFAKKIQTHDCTIIEVKYKKLNEKFFYSAVYTFYLQLIKLECLNNCYPTGKTLITIRHKIRVTFRNYIKKKI